MVHDVLTAGLPSAPRNRRTLELLSYRRIFDMAFPVLTVARRKLGYRFMCAEAAWILDGDDRVATIEPFSKSIHKFSDDGERFFGAYGPKVKEQLRYVVETLHKDPWSRQAVINIWRESPPPTKDVPCTLSLQFLLRGGVVHTIATMRSSDVWLGWPYDVHTFTMITGYMLLKLHEAGAPRYGLGSLTLQAGSEHLYEENFEDAKACLAPDSEQLFSYESFVPWQFHGPDHLVSHLWALARGQTVTATYLTELPHVAAGRVTH